MLVRPSALSLSGGPGVGRVPVTVRSTSFLGGVERHHVEAGDLRLIVDQPIGSGEAVQAKMWLVVDSGRLHLLPGHPG